MFLKELNFDKGILVTITEVSVSNDKSKAKVLVVSHPPAIINKVLLALNSKKGYFRSLLAKRLKLRKIPELEFIEDKGLRIEELLGSLH